MRVLLASIGRFGKGHDLERQLFERYAGRLTTFALTLREIEEKKRLPADALKRREGELLLAAIPEGALVVALDEAGEPLSSQEMADRLAAWRDGGRRDLCFLIGGADGLDGAARQRADLVVSFGRATWPHMLVRALLAEQLFRIQCLLTGHPYHRA